MKLTKIKNFDEFFQIVNTCHGRVELVTDEGDRLNLKSQLSQLISLSNILNDPHTLEHAEVIAHESDDVVRIAEYLQGEKS